MLWILGVPGVISGHQIQAWAETLPDFLLFALGFVCPDPARAFCALFFAFAASRRPSTSARASAALLDDFAPARGDRMGCQHSLLGCTAITAARLGYQGYWGGSRCQECWEYRSTSGDVECTCLACSPPTCGGFDFEIRTRNFECCVEHPPLWENTPHPVTHQWVVEKGSADPSRSTRSLPGWSIPYSLTQAPHHLHLAQ